MLTKKAIDFINMLGSDIPMEENDLPIMQRAGLTTSQIKVFQDLKLPSNTNPTVSSTSSSFPNSYFPYNIETDPLQANDYFGDTTDVSGGAQELKLGESAPMRGIKAPKLDMLDTALSVLPGAAQIGMGLYNVIEGAKEKKRIKAYDKALKKAQENRFHEARLNDFYYTPYTVGRTTDRLEEGGSIPERYKNMGFTRVGQKKDSTRDGKKWMVLAKKGDDYKVVHGGYEGMEDFTQHRNEKRRDNFWNRMGGRDSAKANDPFSPLYWHKKFSTW